MSLVVGQQTWIANANHTSAIATSNAFVALAQTNSKVRIFHLRLTALYVQYVQSQTKRIPRMERVQ